MIWIVSLMIVVTVAVTIGIYNSLVQGRNGFQNAFAQIDVQLTRRHDLIPNLVEVAKGYLRHERETLEAVIAARNTAVAGLKAAARSPGSGAAVAELSGAENALSSALGRLFALAEAYPDLKADRTMAQLSEELTTTENKVAFARQAYNDTVMAYNNLCEMFPHNVVAGAFGFETATLLDIESVEVRKVPQVSFGA